MSSLESAIINHFENKMKTLMFSLPAKIIGVRYLEQLRVDVQPMVNKTFIDEDNIEYPTILNVPVIMPHTNNSAILFPVNQGDTVLLVFCQKEIDGFKTDSTSPSIPVSDRFCNINDAVAIVGFSSFNNSPNLSTKHVLPHNPNDLSIIHNLGTNKEVCLKLTTTGDVVITPPSGSKTIINSPVDIIGDLTLNGNQATSGNTIVSGDVKANGDVKAGQISLINHKHNYTDNGIPMVTSPSIP